MVNATEYRNLVAELAELDQEGPEMLKVVYEMAERADDIRDRLDEIEAETQLTITKAQAAALAMAEAFEETGLSPFEGYLAALLFAVSALKSADKPLSDLTDRAMGFNTLLDLAERQKNAITIESIEIEAEEAA